MDGTREEEAADLTIWWGESGGGARPLHCGGVGLQLDGAVSLTCLRNPPATSREGNDREWSQERRKEGRSGSPALLALRWLKAKESARPRTRPGCKIKALRAKTNTYIKTPVRGEEPVFVVTGRKEDVARAKREILSAAEHFSQIRASRKSSLGALLGAPPGPPATVPGHITIQVRVPYRVVGLVVGPKGATIKRIQHQTHTYIVTPSRDKEPVFEVTGLPESVEAAKREIQAHITLRTGTAPGVVDDTDLLGALCRGGLGSVLGIQSMDQPGSNSSSSSNGAFSSSASCSSSSSSTGGIGMNDLVAIWNGIERDEGIGESPSFESQPTSTSSIWSFPSVALPSRPSPSSRQSSKLAFFLRCHRCRRCRHRRHRHHRIIVILPYRCDAVVVRGPNAHKVSVPRLPIISFNATGIRLDESTV
ncbi:RNA-binding protein MEX3B [Cyphomyrmex costatus]|uniref:RNA-binding protein MEX3B n=1 Tax=Cyphomyrmex costatus TaxID=456900 RepID=A0A195CR06_9HYME|nr:RNA-binding protein MEX3B [Cyphomyrmex costatus]